MNSQRSFAAALLTLMLTVPGLGQAAQHPYPEMAPLSAYMMPDRDAEIALARTAAPGAISDKASVMVLGAKGFTQAVQGTNGFVCIVERAWTSPFDSPQFWNPKIRGPICYNPQGAKSILPITYKRTQLALAGMSKEQIKQAMQAAVAGNELPPLEPGAMCYMLSRQGFLDDTAGHWMPHLMFYVPKGNGVDWGANVDHSPVVFNSQTKNDPERYDLYMIVAPQWSDGTPAPPM